MSFDPFDTPEWRAMDAAQMDLIIAADRWHDFPTDVVVQAQLRNAIGLYRLLRSSWVHLVAAGPAEAAEPAGAMPAPADPAKCTCGHQHAGPEAGGICIGCPCEEVTT